MTSPSIVESRSQQLFPVLSEPELHQLRRFGIAQQYPAGATVVAPGEPSDGLLFILSGTIAVTVHGVSGDTSQIATYGPGAFVGELADLSGRPSSAMVRTLDPLSILVVSAEGLHALLKAKADVGERILRALILRHLGLVEIARTILIGPGLSRNTLRLDRFLDQHGHPHQTLDPAADEITRSLIERLKLDDAELPIVLSPGGRLLCNPTEGDLAHAMSMRGMSDPGGT